MFPLSIWFIISSRSFFWFSWAHLFTSIYIQLLCSVRSLWFFVSIGVDRIYYHVALELTDLSQKLTRSYFYKGPIDIKVSFGSWFYYLSVERIKNQGSFTFWQAGNSKSKAPPWHKNGHSLYERQWMAIQFYKLRRSSCKCCSGGVWIVVLEWFEFYWPVSFAWVIFSWAVI